MAGNELTLEDLPKFKKAYEKAKLEGKDRFTYKGNVLLVSYAKYVIEVMEMHLEGKGG
jgi:hypothetical protein